MRIKYGGKYVDGSGSKGDERLIERAIPKVVDVLGRWKAQHFKVLTRNEITRDAPTDVRRTHHDHSLATVGDQELRITHTPQVGAVNLRSRTSQISL